MKKKSPSTASIPKEIKEVKVEKPVLVEKTETPVSKPTEEAKQNKPPVTKQGIIEINAAQGIKAALLSRKS